MPPRILVVEGDALFAKGLVKALRPHVLVAEALSDGGAAISRLTTEIFDAVVIDLDLQPLGGWPIIELCRSRPSPPLILASGYVDVPTAVRAVRSGVADVVPKPYTAEQLLSQINESLAARSVESPPPQPKRLAIVDSASGVLGDSAAMQGVRDQIRNAARFPDLGVLILGENGTGKELVAESVHELTSPGQPFVTVNCASIPEALFEAELFGHERGEASGSRSERAGLMESAGRGTLFLAEVDAVPAATRAKLLRALENRRFRRVGAAGETELRARVICATAHGSEDPTVLDPFLHRLASFTIVLPPLRSRAEDVDLLANHFVEQLGARYDGRKRLAPAAVASLRAYEWPGNVRELRSVLEHAHVRASGATIEAQEVSLAIAERRAIPRRGVLGSGNYQRPFISVPDDAAVPGAESRRHSSSLRAMERDLVVEAYKSTDSISQAARLLGISRSTLREKLKKYGLR